MSRPPFNDDANSFRGEDLAALWRAISTSSLDGFWVNTLDGKILHVNEAYCRMTGYSHDEMLQMRIADVEALESHEDVLERTRRLLEQGHDRFESRHRTKDGRLIDLEISIQLVPEHEVIIAFLRDISKQKAYSQNLEAALNYKQTLLDTGNVLIVELNTKGETTFVNAYACRLTGFSEDELIGHDWFNLLVPRDRFPEVYEEFERLLEGGLPELFENPILTKSGDIKIISWSNREIRVGDEIVGILSFGIDITDKQQALDELLKVQQRFADIVETAQDLIWACDLEGRFTYFNPAVHDMLGYTPEELVGETFQKITPEDRVAPDREAFEHFLAEGTELFNYESARLTKKGDRVELLINARAERNTAGEIVGMHGTAKDITETKRYLEELKYSETYQRQIVHNAPYGALFYCLDDKDRLIFEGANPAAEKHLGTALELLIGKTIHEVFPGLSDSGIPEIYARIARRGGIYSQDQIDYDEGGIRGAFEFKAFQTVPNRMAVFFNNITDRKRNEQELVRAREQALEANRAKDEFLGVMSHELRTPLTPIIGFTEMLTLQIDDPAQQEFLHHIGEAAQRMLRLVEDILQFSRISSKPPDIQKQAFLPDSFFERELEKLQSSARGNLLKLEPADKSLCTPLPEDLAVISDQDILSQILGNLLNNACKFTANGIITLRYGLDIEDDTSGTLLFEVEDTGIGISSENLLCIWEPFTQIDSSASRNFQGAGLGLAICKRLVSCLDGNIDLESTPNVGTCFRVRIPVRLKKISALEGRTTRKQSLPMLERKPRILIVEDNDMNRLTLETQVRTLGGNVEIASDARQALESIMLAETGHFDLILLDLHLPGTSGFDFFNTLKSRYNPADLPPVIAISADASENIRRRCILSGMQAFIEKPVKLEQLQPELQKWLPTVETTTP